MTQGKGGGRAAGLKRTAALYFTPLHPAEPAPGNTSILLKITPLQGSGGVSKGFAAACGLRGDESRLANQCHRGGEGQGPVGRGRGSAERRGKGQMGHPCEVEERRRSEPGAGKGVRRGREVGE